MARKFRVKRGLKANIPVLDQGEFGFTTDSGAEQLFIGNGSENIQLARQDALNSHASRHASGGADPITPSMIGAVAIGTFSGDLNTLTTPGMYRLDSVSNDVTYADYGNCIVVGRDIADTLGQILIGFDVGLLGHMYFREGRKVSGVWSWGEWRTVATTEYAVNKAGDTMTGVLNFHTDKGSVGTEYSDTVTLAYLRGIFGDTSHLISVGNYGPQYNIGTKDSKWGTNYPILTTKNKPSGNYTGNGDATARTIDTGGIGNAVLVWGVGWAYIVTPHGAFGVGNSGAAYTLPYAEAHFANGVLTLATVYNGINASGTTYYYQVL